MLMTQLYLYVNLKVENFLLYAAMGNGRMKSVAEATTAL